MISTSVGRGSLVVVVVEGECVQPVGDKKRRKKGFSRDNEGVEKTATNERGKKMHTVVKLESRRRKEEMWGKEEGGAAEKEANPSCDTTENNVSEIDDLGGGDVLRRGGERGVFVAARGATTTAGVEEGAGPSGAGFDGVGGDDEFTDDVALALGDDEAEGGDAGGGDVELGDFDVAVAEAQDAARGGGRRRGPLELAARGEDEVARVPALEVGRLLHQPARQHLAGALRGSENVFFGRFGVLAELVLGGDGDLDEVFPAEAELSEREFRGDAQNRMRRRDDEADEDRRHGSGDFRRIPPRRQRRGLHDLAQETGPEQAQSELALHEYPRDRERHRTGGSPDGHGGAVQHRVDRDEERQQIQGDRDRAQRPAQRAEVVLRVALRHGLRLDVQRVQRGLREERRQRRDDAEVVGKQRQLLEPNLRRPLVHHRLRRRHIRLD
eukprot:CAMPEP_0198650888 /NCGR_PEP_ID=MMETSP1467-20131203/5292_1 /TAXON_ID=1462469 /ORGANISM="unid. sp., Strain CCMP2135" /LENGTH=439 /DNA_ID=CAMNT_0044386755 /DNA_START=136 /DNA_END=1453 /DNA_ORIENTATION=-